MTKMKMMKIKFWMLLCALCMAAFAFQACEEEDDVPQVGVCLKNPSNDWRKSLKRHIESGLNKYGLTYSIAQSKTTEEQGNAVQAMVNKGCEVLVVTPEGEAKETLNAAITAGMPVIFVESAPVTGYKSLIEISNTEIGKSAAGFFNKQEVKKVALFSITQDVVSSEARIAGLKAALTQGVEVKEFTLENYTNADGKKAVLDILANHTDVDAVYAQDDDVALGVLAGITEMSSLQIKAVVGCGGSSTYFNKIKTTPSINLATTLYSPKALMEKAAEVAEMILDGKEVEAKYSLTSELVDKDNVNEHLSNPTY